MKPKIDDLFESMPDWAWLRDMEGRILDVNAAALRRMGYARKDLIGKPASDFYYDPKDIPRGEEWARSVLREGPAYHVATLRDKEGRPIEVEQHGALVRLDGKKAVLIVARDIGPQLRDHRLALTLYEAFRRSNDVMFYCDRNGTILDVNEAFVGRYGWKREEAVGRTPRILRSRHSSNNLYKRMWDAIMSKGHWRGEMINKTKDGREIPLILTITTVRDKNGEIVGYISNAVDMTEHMALQARVADSEALASVGEMAAVVAHEIRNPLGSIVMAARQLENEISASDRATVMRLLRAESERLNEALTNFLAFARPRDLKLGRTDLNGLVKEVARMISANNELLAGAKIEIELARDLKPLTIDSDQIRQVLWNLVINAVQALEGRGTVSVRTGKRDGRAFLDVEDTGPGIPNLVMASLFKPFQTTKQQGTGLGLAIAERIVKAHGGTISVKTGKTGTTFTVSLPPSGE